MNDEIAELADRLRAKLRRGEEPGLEFEIEFASLTDDERDEFLVLFDQRASHGEESSEDSPRTSGSCARFSTYWSPAARRPARRWGRLSRPVHQRAGGRRGDPRDARSRWLTRCVRPRPTGRWRYERIATYSIPGSMTSPTNLAARLSAQASITAPRGPPDSSRRSSQRSITRLNPISRSVRCTSRCLNQ